ncbi:MAG TPA: hypothetical protein VFG39_07380 [Balneolaceae bacterium]|nr:hypothetical protein [Balneolaceae bacterium]
MKPLERTFSHSKEEVMNSFPPALHAAEMPITGRNDELGLISFRESDDFMIYAHIVEESDQLTRVSVAPGLSYLSGHDPSEMPETTIEKVLKNVEQAMNEKAMDRRPV